MQTWIQITTVIEYGTMFLLFSLSIWSIAIMADRRKVLKNTNDRQFAEKARSLIQARNWSELRAAISSNPSLQAGALRAALEANGPLNSSSTSGLESLDRAVKSYLVDSRRELETGLPWLATLGANAPFVGLFGTVLGIIRAFAALGADSGAASSVMSGISQALYATAAGLFVAIPAVVAFNYFNSKLRTTISDCESLKDLLASRIAPGQS